MFTIDEINAQIDISHTNDINSAYENVYNSIKNNYVSIENTIDKSLLNNRFNSFQELCEKSSKHPLIESFNNRKLSEDGLLYFSKAFYAHIYHSFEDVMFKICVNSPPYVDLRLEIIRNLWDEFGSGKKEDIHLRIYEQSLLKPLNISSLNDTEVSKLNTGDVEEEYKIFISKYQLEREVIQSSVQWSNIGNLPYMAALGAIVLGSEFTPRVLFPPIVNCLKNTGLDGGLSKFFSMHIIVDKKHYSDLKSILLKHIKNHNDLIEVEAGLRIMLQIRNDFFTHLYTKNIFL